MTVKDPSIKLNQTEATLAVNETVKLTATTAPKSAASSVTYTTSDEKVATVANDGTVTAVAAGEATITASAKCGTKTVTATAKITVKKTVFKTVAQSKLNELTAEIAGETKDLKATDFSIVNTGTKIVYPVSKVTVDSKDTTKVTLALFSELKDGQNYDVTLDGVTKSFKASDGQVASVAVDPITIPYATETDIKLISKDANGVVVKELAYPSTDANYDFTITTNSGYTTGSKLYLNKVGDTATAEVTYKTGKYNANGQPEGNITNKVTITAVDQAAISNFDVRIGEASKKYDDIKDNKKIAVGETSARTAYFMIKDANGKEIASTAYATYTLESSDTNVLMLASGTMTNKSVLLTPVKAGAAYILVKDKDNKIVASIAIDVVAEKTVATLELDTASVTVSKDATLDQQKDVKVTLKDQYGDVIKPGSGVFADFLSSSNGKKADQVSSLVEVAPDCSKVTVKGKNIDKGTYIYKIAYKKNGKEVVAKTLSIIVQEPSATVDSYRLDVTGLDSSNSTDIKVEGSNFDATSKDITVKLMGLAGGVDKAYQDISAISVKDPNGNEICKLEEGGTITGSAVVAGFISQPDTKTLKIESISVSAYKATKNLSAGTYKVSVTTGTGATARKFETSFVVKDSQPAATGVLDKNTAVTGTLETVLQNTLKVTYNGTTYTGTADNATNGTKALGIASAKVMKNDGDIVTTGTLDSGAQYTIQEVKVTVVVAKDAGGNDIEMDITVPVSGTITVTAS